MLSSARSRDKLETLAQKIEKSGGDAHIFVEDLSLPNSGSKLFDQIRSAGHSIDILNKINKDSKRLNKTQNELLNWMKSQGELKRRDVWNKAKTMDIKERTLADILRRFLDLDLIKKVNHGVYMVR